MATFNFNNYANKVFRFIEENTFWVLIIIFFGNLLLKGMHAAGTGLWYDEGFSIFHGQKPINDIIEVCKTDQNPPFYHILLKIWINIFGVGEFATRFLSVIFSSLTAVVLFLFAKKNLNIHTAIISSLLYTISAAHLYYSHEVRSYELVSLLSVCSFFLFFELFKKPTLSRLLLLGILNAIILYTHFLPVFLFVVQFISAFLNFKNKKGLLFYLVSQILTLVFFSPWLLNLYGAYNQIHQSFWLAEPTWNDFVNVLSDLASGKDLLYSYLILIMILIVFIFIKSKHNLILKNILILFLWGFLPITLIYLISFYTPVFLLRYVLFVSIGFILFISYLLSFSFIKNWIRYAVVLLFVVVTAFRLDLNPQKNQNVKDVTAEVKKEKTQNTLIILSSTDLTHLFTYYFDRKLFEDYNNIGSSLSMNNVIAVNDSMGLSTVNWNRYEKVFLIQSFEKLADPLGTVLNKLNKNLINLKTSKEYSGITYSIFKNDNFNPNEIPFDTITFSLKESRQPLKEGDLGWFGTANLNSELAKSGKFSSKINKDNPYSLTFSALIDTLKIRPHSEFELSAFIYSRENLPPVNLAVSFEDKETGQNLGYYSYYIGNSIRKNEWVRVKFFSDCVSKKNTLVKAYAYYADQKQKSVVYLDDLEMKFIQPRISNIENPLDTINEIISSDRKKTLKEKLNTLINGIKGNSQQLANVARKSLELNVDLKKQITYQALEDLKTSGTRLTANERIFLEKEFNLKPLEFKQ